MELNVRINALFARQEQEDWNRLFRERKKEICREFLNSESVIDTAQKYTDFGQESEWRQFLKYYRQHWRKFLKLSIEQVWIRTESEFSIRKHTACQIPYYHSHDFYELIYVCYGICSQYLNGEDKELVLYAGESCILTPGTIHAILPGTSDSLVLKLIIPAGYMKQILDLIHISGSMKSELEELYKNYLQNHEVLVFRFCKESEALQHLMQSLLEESMEERLYGEIVLKNLLSLLLIQLARHGQEKVQPDLLQKIISYIRQNLQSASMQALAESMGYSTRHLSRKIQEKTGGTFSDILQKVRLEEAAVMLRETDLTVEQIAERTGYQSISGIYKRFQAVFHMTPNEYRKRNRRYRL